MNNNEDIFLYYLNDEEIVSYANSLFNSMEYLYNHADLLCEELCLNKEEVKGDEILKWM